MAQFATATDFSSFFITVHERREVKTRWFASSSPLLYQMETSVFECRCNGRQHNNADKVVDKRKQSGSKQEIKYCNLLMLH